MQRLYNLDKWAEVPEGKAMFFSIDKARVVRAEVNSAGPVNLYMLMKEDGGQEMRFLARIEGRDTIEFITPGAFGLVVDGGSLWVYTVDGDTWTYTDPAPEIFTRIHERRQRNPELEYMMAKMQHNMERRLAQQAHELARVIARRDVSGETESAHPLLDRAADQGAEASAGGPGGRPDKPARKRATDTGRRDDEE